MKLFSELRSCYRPHSTPSSSAPPPYNDQSHHVLLPASHRNRLHGSHWRPSLSVIMEDSVAQDHHDNVDKKSLKKSFTKPRSWINTSSSFHNDLRKRNCMPAIIIPPFSAVPFMI